MDFFEVMAVTTAQIGRRPSQKTWTSVVDIVSKYFTSECSKSILSVVLWAIYTLQWSQ